MTRVAGVRIERFKTIVGKVNIGVRREHVAPGEAPTADAVTPTIVRADPRAIAARDDR